MHRLRLCAKCHLHRFILFHRRKTPNFVIFCGDWRFVVSPFGSVWRKLNMSAQPQTFPYPTASKVFCIPMPSRRNRAVKFRRSQTWRHKRDGQTFLAAPRWEISERHQTWHADRAPQVSSFTLKIFEGPAYSFAARGAHNLGDTALPQLKTR